MFIEKGVSLEIRKGSVEEIIGSAGKGYYWKIGKGVEEENSSIGKGLLLENRESSIREGFVEKMVAKEEILLEKGLYQKSNCYE
ncbi:29837_t:CDS:2 [Gigaspora margarita]|uniref:29837_t:CDS:1 n=1 Tax=Gigaspora margarita TaxID=4874 RepID=A0ABN7V209_GIGMA|nr:29837_t:CDS:2 [Gigaspora margarita]